MVRIVGEGGAPSVVVYDAAHVVASDNIAFTGSAVIVTHDAAHVTTSDNINILANAIAVNDASHVMTSTRVPFPSETNFDHILTSHYPYAAHVPYATPEIWDWFAHHYDVMIHSHPDVDWKVLDYNPFVTMAVYSNYTNIAAFESEQWTHVHTWTAAQGLTETEVEDMYAHFFEDHTAWSYGDTTHAEIGFFDLWIVEDGVESPGSVNLNSWTKTLQILDSVDDAIYMGWSEGKFCTTVLQLTGAASDVTLVWEYWDGDSWEPLTVTDDPTNAFTVLDQRLTVSFNVPTDWARRAMFDDEWTCYYARIRVSAVGASPVSPIILGFKQEVFPLGDTSTLVTIRGWDPDNDVDGDGWVNNAEFASLVNPNATARFRWQSRWPYGGGRYVYQRWITNLIDANLQAWSADYMVWRIAGQNVLGEHCNALMIDNVALGPASKSDFPIEEFPNGTAPPGGDNWAEYQQGHLDTLTAIRASLASAGIDWCQINVSAPGNQGAYDRSAVAGVMETEKFGATGTSPDSFELQVAQTYVATRSTPGIEAVMLEFSSIASGFEGVGLIDGSRDRHHLMGLAWYYLIADYAPNAPTYYAWGGEPFHSMSWDPDAGKSEAWCIANEYDIGAVLGDYYTMQSGADPEKPWQTYKIFARNYTNALVIIRHLSPGSPMNDLTYTYAITVPLGGSYQPLQADGTLGSAITEASMRAAEGMILIPV